MDMRISSPAMDLANSSIEQVTVYRRGARVRRVVEVPKGATEVVVGHLPLALDDASVRASAQGDVRATDVRIGVAVPPLDASLAPPKDEELRAARVAVARARGEVERIEAGLARLEMLAIAPRPATKKGERPPATPADARLALVKARTAEAERLGKELAAAKGEVRKAERLVADLEDRAKRASTARNAREHQLFKTATVRVEGGAGSVAIEYVVPGARWAPAYTLWLDSGSARVAMRALVAQRTGEDWRGARLVLSTAAPDRFTELPEMAKLRIGRAQPRRAKRGFRAPPEGAVALFADHDRTFGPPGAFESGIEDVPSMIIDAPVSLSQEQDLLEEEEPVPTPMILAAHAPPAQAQAAARSSGLLGGLFGSAPGGGAPPPPKGAPMPMASMAMPMAAPADERARLAPAELMRKEYAADKIARKPDLDLPPSPELDLDVTAMAYGRLRLFGAHDERRGELCAVTTVELYLDGTSLSLDVASAVRVSLGLAGAAGDELPPGYVLAEATEDAFDYAYVADLPCDVPSDGAYHSVPVAEHAAKARLHHVTVPREASDVFRTLEVESPLDAALLEGPVDVYERRRAGFAYLLTGTIPSTPPRGRLSIGLGVEQGIKVARNTSYQEQSKGLLGGALALVHEIAIDLTNATSSPVTVEVRERVPVKREDDDDIEITIGAADPPWKEWNQDETLDGGRRWIVPLALGESKKLTATYTVKIASKNQLVGGNRRES